MAKSTGRTPDAGRRKSHAIAFLLALIPLLWPLADSGFGGPRACYLRAEQLFDRGSLDASQELSEKGYLSFRETAPDWASRFALLTAKNEVWRGLYSEALVELSVQPAKPYAPEESVLLLSLEGMALARTQRYAEAEYKLILAEDPCKTNNYTECGLVPMGRGIEALERGQFDGAKGYFLSCLKLSRQHHDSPVELLALLDLGFVSLETAHFDEAVGWSRSAYRAGQSLGDENQIQASLGNLAWAYVGLGDSDRALGLFLEALGRARRVGNPRDELKWLTALGYIYAQSANVELARSQYGQALQIARRINSKGDITDILIGLGLAAVAAAEPDEADSYSNQALGMAVQSGNHPDAMDAIAVQMQAAALRGDTTRAEQLLKTVETDPDSQTSMKWACEDAIARLYEKNGQTAQARAAYESALSIFESARAELQHADSQLPFLANATRIYDDYIHFLVTQGKTQQALLVADQSRARTLAQGLGQSEAGKPFRPASFSPQAVARKANATLLFYWLGQRQSYLWAVTPAKTTLFQLSPEREITPLLDRYRKALLGSQDPLEANNAAGQALYTILVAPAASVIQPGNPVMILADGPLSQLNFETLIAPRTSNAPSQKPHYWIEDVTLSAAPSLAMLAQAKPERDASHAADGKLLLLGDPISSGEEYPQLPYAADEMQRVKRHFTARNEVVFSQREATPHGYLASNPRQFAYIHFVSHGVASQTDPLDSAIILSRADSPGAATGEQQDSFKLYAREVMQHPIDARLVTISACYGSGTRAYVGEGLVGLSWAFLRAGAHSAIGALWEASDNSTPQLMDTLYQGLADGQSPAAALRRAKLAMLRSSGNFRKPFYWAPFQIYTRL